MKCGFTMTALLSLLITSSVYSQWIQTDGPYGNTKISSIFAYNDQLYAGTSCGLHSISSATGRWTLRASFNVEAFLLKGNMMYFGGPNLGIRIMNMNDQTFQHTSGGLNGETVMTILDGDTCLYASVENQGFRKSKGNSTDWVIINGGLPAVRRFYDPSGAGPFYYTWHVNTIALVNDTLLCGTHEGVRRMPAGGNQWSVANTGLPAANVQQLKVVDNTIYACVGNNLYSSTNIGTSWQFVHAFGAEISSVNVFENNILVTTLGNGIFGFVQEGQEWQTFNQGLGDLTITGITHLGNTPVCTTQTGDVYFLTGNQWVSNSKGIICTTILSMVATPSALVVNDDQNVFVSSPNAYPWEVISPDTDRNYFGPLAAIGDTIFISYKSRTHESLVKYRLPGSNTWNDLQNPPPYKGHIASNINTGNKVLWAYEDDRLHMTGNLGQTWTEHSIPSFFCGEVTDFEVFHGMPFAVSCNNAVLLRMDNNQQWQLANNGLPPDGKVTSMAYSEDALYAFVDQYGMFVSLDSAQTWQSATNGFSASFGIHSHAFRGQDIFVTTAKGVFYSIDHGQNWTSLNDGLPNKPVGPMVIYNDTLWVATHSSGIPGAQGNGIYKRDLASIPTSKKESEVTIKRINIYPNPAREFVYFDLPDAQTATIQLIDMLGRVLLTTRLDEQKRIPIDRYASGTYVIVITTDRYVYNSVLIKKR